MCPHKRCVCSAVADLHIASWVDCVPVTARVHQRMPSPLLTRSVIYTHSFAPIRSHLYLPASFPARLQKLTGLQQAVSGGDGGAGRSQTPLINDESAPLLFSSPNNVGYREPVKMHPGPPTFLGVCYVQPTSRKSVLWWDGSRPARPPPRKILSRQRSAGVMLTCAQ